MASDTTSSDTTPEYLLRTLNMSNSPSKALRLGVEAEGSSAAVSLAKTVELTGEETPEGDMLPAEVRNRLREPADSKAEVR
jgi:hypothetical protein